MSVNHVADAQDATTAAGEEESSAADTQRNPQGEKVPASADGDDYQAQRDAFLRDEAEFLKEAADAAPEEEAEPAEEKATEEAEAPAGEEVEPAADAAVPDKPAEDEATEEEHSPKRKHVNLSRMGEEKAKLVLYLDRNPDVPLDKAVEILGIKLTPEQQQQTEAASGLPATVTEAEARIEALWEERTKAFGDELDFKRAADLDREIAKLQKHAGNLKDHEFTARSEEASRFNAELSESKQNALKYYPDCAIPDSPLTKKMLELDALLEETGDDRFHSSDKPFLLAKLAAKEIGKAPANPNAAKTEAAPVKSPPSAPAKVPTSPVQPARGNARTQQTNTQAGTLDELVDKVQDEDSYEAAKRAVLKSA